MDRGGLREYRSIVKASDILPPELEPFWRLDDGRTALQRAEAYGIDVSLLEENLRLSPLERLRQNDRSLNEATALRQAYLMTHAHGAGGSLRCRSKNASKRRMTVSRVGSMVDSGVEGSTKNPCAPFFTGIHSTVVPTAVSTS